MFHYNITEGNVIVIVINITLINTSSQIFIFIQSDIYIHPVRYLYSSSQIFIFIQSDIYIHPVRYLYSSSQIFIFIVCLFSISFKAQEVFEDAKGGYQNL